MAEQITVEAEWGEDVPLPVFANVTGVQATPDGEVILSFAHVAPAIIGSQERQKQIIENLRTHGATAHNQYRVVMTRDVALKLMGALREQVGG